MNIVDYDVVISGNKILVFVNVEEFPTTTSTISYKTLHNIIYKLSDGYCIADRRGTPLIIRNDLILCEEFLNSEYAKKYNVLKPVMLDVNEN